MARTGKPGLIHLDTHIVCWLYEARLDLLSDASRAAIEQGRLLVSPIVGLELQYLHEIGRISRGPGAILSALAAEIGLAVDQPPLAAIADRARELSWTRDPFDRLIVANALHTGGRLVTKDALIRKHCKAALW
ncbi:MAG: PIN domain-containing protein [Nitrosomonadales bacterium]|nr:PIN domain-containing protein [Nitrosomonadales bacterium]